MTWYESQKKVNLEGKNEICGTAKEIDVKSSYGPWSLLSSIFPGIITIPTSKNHKEQMNQVGGCDKVGLVISSAKKNLKKKKN